MNESNNDSFTAEWNLPEVNLKTNSLSLSTSDFDEIFGSSDAEKFPLSFGGLSGDAELSTHSTDELLISSIQQSLEMEPLTTKPTATPTKDKPSGDTAMEIGGANGNTKAEAQDPQKVCPIF